MILLIDNYDSFTYNLYQAIGQLYEDITVIRNDKLTIEQIQNMQPEAIIISPGPGYPKDAGISVAVIEKFSGTIPILGVCLGHQSIAHYPQAAASTGRIVQVDARRGARSRPAAACGGYFTSEFRGADRRGEADPAGDRGGR